MDASALAQELMTAYSGARIVPIPPSSRDPRFDLTAAYAVEAELVRMRRSSGRATVGRKVGFANKALWRVLKLDTLVWAHMYDDTVRYAQGGVASMSVSRMCSPKIEPEIVFKLRNGVTGTPGPHEVLQDVEWLALGFEIVDCVFADWKYQPADFVAAFGLHAGLVVGEPQLVNEAAIPALVEQLPRFTVTLLRDGTLVGQGSGRNSLRSPALCLCELAAAISRHDSAEPLRPGELVSSGTLTDSHAIFPGETWMATVEGLDLPQLTLRTVV